MRRNGILMPLSSLPARHGIGDFGPQTYQFVDYLAKTGVHIWQILPFNALGYGNSPYQPLSSIAGDEIFLSLDLLAEEGFLLQEEIPAFEAEALGVDYAAVRGYKRGHLKRAFARFCQNPSPCRGAFETFLSKNPWVHDSSVFLSLKNANCGRPWTQWPTEHRDWPLHRESNLSPYEEDIAYHRFLQFLFHRQWTRLKAYANRRGIEIMGDLPFYVGLDSVDVWANRQFFLLDAQCNPTHVAGVPPDFFNEAGGQRWGNPLYHWEALEQDGFQFWMERLRLNQGLFDCIRLDHFRAFDTYWKIPAAEETAVLGQWEEAPGYAFFDRLFQVLPDISLVVEDLGDLRPEVGLLRDYYQFMGMNIMQFSFGEKKPRGTWTAQNRIAYTGTHDNSTVLGWFLALSKKEQRKVQRRMKQGRYKGNISEQMIQYTLDSRADIAIIPLWDILGLDNSACINTPGTIGSPNWEWKLANYAQLQQKLNQHMQWLKQYGRINP